MAKLNDSEDARADVAVVPAELRRVLDLAMQTEPDDAGGDLDPELVAAAARQHHVVTLLHGGGPATPDGLRERIASSTSARRRPRAPAFVRPVRSRAWGVGLAGAGLVVAAIAAVVVLITSGGSGTLSASKVADAWTLPATSHAVAARVDNPAVLAVSFHGTGYPNYRDDEGWHAVGSRSDPVGGRSAFTVYYATGKRRAAYTVVAGTRVSTPSSARRFAVGGVQMAEFRSGDRWIIVFANHGNSCVLTAAAPRERTWLVKLAAWHRSGDSLS
jgi:hypothetical protein